METEGIVRPDPACWVIASGYLFGRAGPSQDPWDVGAMRAAGVASVVSLVELPDSERRAIEDNGIDHVSVPFHCDMFVQPYDPRAGNLPPLQNDFVLDVFAAFDECLARHPVASGARVVVHCEAGKDRTGLLAAYHLMTREGMDAKGALDEVCARRKDAFFHTPLRRIARSYEPAILARRTLVAGAIGAPRVGEMTWDLDAGVRPRLPVRVAFSHALGLLQATVDWRNPHRSQRLPSAAIPDTLMRLRGAIATRRDAHARRVLGGRLDRLREGWARTRIAELCRRDDRMRVLTEIEALCEMACEDGCGLRITGCRMMESEP